MFCLALERLNGSCYAKGMKRWNVNPIYYVELVGSTKVGARIMPIHDWTRVDAGLFHAFHHRWIDALCDALNGGVLPADYFALPEQRIQGPIPDV